MSAAPERQTPTAPERGGMRALLFSVAGLFLLFLPFPLPVLGIGLLIAGIGFGIQARRRARRVLTQAPGSVAAIAVGGFGICLALVAVVLGVLLAGELVGYEKCRESALTMTDRQTCQNEYFPKLERKLHLPRGSLNRYRSVM